MTSALPAMIACEVCGAKVTNTMILKVHIKNKHSNENKTKPSSKISCDECDYETSNKASLALHIRKEHGDRDHDKKKVEKVESRLKDINKVTPHPAKKRRSLEKRTEQVKPKSKNLEELISKEKEKVFTPEKQPNFLFCEDCKVSFTTKQGLDKHKEEEHRHDVMKTLYSCSACPMTFAMEELMDEHCKSAICITKPTEPTALPKPITPTTPPKPSTPTTNPKTTSDPEPSTPSKPETEATIAIKKAIPATTKELSKCDLCDRRFETYVGLCTHKRFKHGVQKRKKYECEICEIRLVSGPALVEHMRSKHSKDEELSERNSPPQKKLKEGEQINKNLQKENDELKQVVKYLQERLKEKDKIQVPEEETEDENINDIEMKTENNFEVVRHKRRSSAKSKESLETQKLDVASEQRQQFINLNLCEQCGEVFRSGEELKVHIEAKHRAKVVVEEEIWSCKECDYQANNIETFNNHCIETGHSECKYDLKCKKCKEVFNSEDELIEHRRKEHPSSKVCRDFPNCPRKEKCLHIHKEQNIEVISSVEQETTEETQKQEKCYLCNKTLKSKRELSNHIKVEHKTYQPCRNFVNNSCTYNDDCRFNHVILEEGTQICFKCGKIETSKTALMKHVKETHGSIPCTKFKNGICRFNESSCIFSHTNVVPCDPQQNAPPTIESQQDFPQAWQVKPPDQQQLITKVVTEVMNQMMPQIIELVLQKLN